MLSQGIKVRALVRPTRKEIQWIGSSQVEIVRGDLLDPPSLVSAVQGADYIIHIAGVTKAKRNNEYYEGNVTATRNLLDAASHLPSLKKFCHVSSLTVVGPSDGPEPPNENTLCRPISTYGRSKWEAEKVCLEYGSTIPLVILRPPTVYGPRDRDVLEMFKAARLGIQPTIGSADKTLSLIYGPDLAEAIVLATLSEKTVGKTYFAADPTIYRQAALFDILTTMMGKKSVRVKFPAPLLYSVAVVVQAFSFFGPKPAILSIEKARDLLQDHWTCNPERIGNDIGFRARTNAEQGLRLTYLWYKVNGWL